MATQTDNDITLILQELGTEDDGTAVARLLPLVYRELRLIAGNYLRNEPVDHTLQATALVHEAYVRLAGSNNQSWNDRAHFFRVAAKTMRRILINHAHKRNAIKRGSGQRGLMLSETALITKDRNIEILELDDALCRFAEFDPMKAEVVELRYFGGCTIEETAEALGISTASVERHWRFARAWLKTELFPNV